MTPPYVAREDLGLTPPWFACYTRARHEKRVEERLGAAGFPTFLPVARLERDWHDRKKIVSWPLFPGYVFVRFGLDSLSAVLGTAGMVNVVRVNGVPASISDSEIQNISRFADALGPATTLPAPEPFSKGQPVQVTSGPFAGVEGVVLELRGHGRAVVSVGLRALEMGIRVEIDAAVLEPVVETRYDPSDRPTVRPRSGVAR